MKNPSLHSLTRRHIVGASSLGITSIVFATVSIFASTLNAAEAEVWEALAGNGCKPGNKVVIRRTDGKLAVELYLTDPNDPKVTGPKMDAKNIVEKDNVISFDVEYPESFKEVAPAKAPRIELKLAGPLVGKSVEATIVSAERKILLVKQEK